MVQRKLMQNLTRKLKDNIVEIWGLLALFIGLPLVAALYFDYRAALLTFSVASIIVTTLVLRSSE